jgi:simple sugar transport system ATP-binding protein
LKVLAVGARFLILDEPTAVLTDREAAALLALVRTLAAQALSVVLITHKLREVAAGADRASVMRDGRMAVAALPTEGMDGAALAREMMGASPPTVGRTPRRRGAVRLAVDGLSVRRIDGMLALDGVSLSLRAGEIVGVAGVGGNGQQELADALVGLAPAERGRIVLEGTDVTAAPVWRRRRLGLRYVPSDRAVLALVGDLSVADNLALSAVRTGRFGRLLLARRAMRRAAQAAIAGFAIAGATPGGGRACSRAGTRRSSCSPASSTAPSACWSRTRPRAVSTSWPAPPSTPC